MSYTKQTWQNNAAGGTPLSADRLNYIEDGIKNATDAADNKVTKTGDIMSGNLNINKSQPAIYFKDTEYAHDDSAPSALTEHGAIYLRDKNDKFSTQIISRVDTSNNLHTIIDVGRYGTTASTSSYIWNTLDLYITSAGARGVTVTDPTAWKNAIISDSGWTNVTPESEACHYKKVGDFVIVDMVYVTAKADWVTKFTLPTGYRPAYTMYSSLFYLDSSARNGGLRVDPDGKVQTYGSMNSPYWCGSIVFPVNR